MPPRRGSLKSGFLSKRPKSLLLTARNQKVVNVRRNPARTIHPVSISAHEVGLKVTHVHYLYDDARLKLLDPLAVNNTG